MIEKQIELEKQMTQLSIDNYRNELQKAKENHTFGVSRPATQLILRVLEEYKNSIDKYLKEYSAGNPVKSTIAADVISRIPDSEVTAYISARVILNAMYSSTKIQSLYKAIGQSLEDEFKMSSFRDKNSDYYTSIQSDLNRRGANIQRKKNVTTGVFRTKLEFMLDRWTITEKFHAGMVLLHLFMESTGLIKFEDVYLKRKHFKYVTPTDELTQWFEKINEKLELLQPLFLPMVCKPKEWTGVLEGGYISPYLKRNKLVKNNNKEYLTKLNTAEMPIVYNAINHLQNTSWQINRRILEVVNTLWEEGRAIADLPDREDEVLTPFPYPSLDLKNDALTQEQQVTIKNWKREVYEIHKRNVQQRSVRILTAQILKIAEQFKDYEKIYYPYQMDFRGRLYPVPVLLQPQGSDLAKGLLRFAEGKEVDEQSIKWLKIHGANVYGYDKESYEKRINWIDSNSNSIKSYAQNPLGNRGWAEADKPFQFLAFCFEYNDYLYDPDGFRTYIPVQLDGTCNGLQHYSALLRDETGAKAVNLIDSDKPSDIYETVAEKLKEKLNAITRNNARDVFGSCEIFNNTGTTCVYSGNTSYNIASIWLNMGINRKLTKRPVMVLPYGGTRLSCREYISDYLKENYSSVELWKRCNIGTSPQDCVYKISLWLSKYLWEAITEIVRSAIHGMDYLKKLAQIINRYKPYIEWTTPVGLTVRQEYKSRRKTRIETELFGSIRKCRINIDTDENDKQRQVNGVCPNFIHSLDAACLMLYLNKCKEEGITSFMTIHDSYGTYACDTEKSAKLLREAFFEIYSKDVLKDFTQQLLTSLTEEQRQQIASLIPELPGYGSLNIEEVLKSKYFFN